MRDSVPAVVFRIYTPKHPHIRTFSKFLPLQMQAWRESPQMVRYCALAELCVNMQKESTECGNQMVTVAEVMNKAQTIYR